MSFDENLHELKLTDKIYILALRSSLKKTKVSLQWSISEFWINGYMKGLSACWIANHYFEFVLDAYSSVVYICDYMTKSPKGMIILFMEGCGEAQAGNLSLKQSFRHMGSKFPNSVELFEIEAWYEILQLLFS